MNYDETINYLQTHCHKPVALGLARMELMAELMGNPHLMVPVVHVAGTNGKGSTTAMLGAILRASGYRVGTYTSPHLISYRERICQNDTMISEEDFALGLGEVIGRCIPVLEERGLGHPKEFELLTMLAFWYFSRSNLDIVVLEVGLGGRLDSTNIVTPLLSVITPISLDHTQILGDTLAQIAWEKAGIIKDKRPVVAADQSTEVLAVLAKVAKEKESPLVLVRPEAYGILEKNLAGQRFFLKTKNALYEQVRIGFLGDYQVQNAQTALYAAEVLQDLGWKEISVSTITEGLALAKWPGRMEYWTLGGERGILLDGAHNLGGIEALVLALKQDFANRRLILLLGILDDKAQEVMIQALAPLADRVLVTKPSEQRAGNWQALERMVQEVNPHLPVRLFLDYHQAIDEALGGLQAGDLLCITGSLYLLGSCRAYVLEKLDENNGFAS